MSKASFLGGAALCALVGISVTSLPAAADAPRGRRSLAQCTAFDQREKNETSVEMTVHSTCTMPIDCKVSWQLVCAPESRKRRKVTPSSVAFTLATDATQATEASAAECGDDGWVIKNVTWRCEPSKD